MADFSQFFPTLMQEEGGSKLTNIPGDAGGWTKWGITLATWEAQGKDLNEDGVIDLEDLKLATIEDAMPIAKTQYWDILRCDDIVSQSVAEFTMDWGYNSGDRVAAKHLQLIVGASPDGQMGDQTLSLVNAADPLTTFNLLKAARKTFYLAIESEHPEDIKFNNGWMNRVNNFPWKG